MNLLPGHRISRKNPPAAAERHLAQHKSPAKSIVEVGQRSGEIHHRHEEKHHDSEEQARPAHLNFCGNAQRSGQQSNADEIGPEDGPGHKLGHQLRDASGSREMLRAEDRQRQSEKEIAECGDLIEAASL
jgi:hypothetical protein